MLKNVEETEYHKTWCFAGSLELETYKLDTVFEENCINVLEKESSMELCHFDNVWELVGATMIDNTYDINSEFEGTFDDYSYEVFFSSLTKTSEKFVNSEMFEKQCNDLVKNVNIKKDRKNKLNAVKNGKKNSLKSLMEARTKRLKLMEDYIKTIKDDASSKVVYECRSCGFQAKWQRKLYFTHIIPTHLECNKKTNKKKKVVKKKSCQIESIIVRKYICGNLDCHKTFSKIANRKRHMLSVHKVILRIKCPTCDKCFRDRLDLDRHVKFKHNKLTDYRCPMCAFKTKWKFNLIRHEKVKHESSQFDPNGNIVCDICKQTFTKQYSMAGHINAHKAIKIGYDCVICDKVKQEKHVCSFSCSKCDRSFDSRKFMKLHLKIHDKLSNVTKSLTKIGDHDVLKQQLLTIKY